MYQLKILITIITSLYFATGCFCAEDRQTYYYVYLIQTDDTESNSYEVIEIGDMGNVNHSTRIPLASYNFSTTYTKTKLTNPLKKNILKQSKAVPLRHLICVYKE